MATSPTQLSLKHMRDRGYYAEVVERFNFFTKRKNDFAGFIDLLCLSDGVIGVQTTSYSNMSARVNKIKQHENYPIVVASGIKIEVHGWHKVKNRWQVRIVEL
jgi:hypothetical protein